jgi:hypothetical protein
MVVPLVVGVSFALGSFPGSDKFPVGPLTSLECPTYSRAVSSLAACEDAAQDYGLDPGIGNTTVFEESNQFDPPGCFVHSTAYNTQVHYNRAWGQAKNPYEPGDRYVVCHAFCLNSGADCLTPQRASFNVSCCPGSTCVVQAQGVFTCS